MIATSIVDPEAPKAAAAKPAPKPEAPAKPAAAEKPAAPKASARKERPARSGRAAPAKKSARGKAGAASTRRGARQSADAGDEAEEAKPARRGAAAGRGRAAAGGARAARGASARGAARGRRGAAEEVEAKSKTPVLIGSAVGVAVLGIGLYFAFAGGGDKTTKVDDMKSVAKKNEEPKKDASKKPGPKKDDKVAKKPEDTSKKPADAVADASKGDKKAEEASTAKKDAKKSAKKPAKKAKGAKKTAKATPFDAKTLPVLDLPEDLSDEDKKKVLALADTAIQDEGIRGMRALKELGENPRAAIPALTNELRKLDYMDADYAQTGFVVYKALEKMTMGRTPRYRAPTPGQPVKQEDAWWNAKCVKALHRLYDMIGAGSKEGWDEFVEKRKKNLAEKK